MGPGKRLVFAGGEEKLLQELRLWIGEPLGIGPTTPRFGSILSSLIGSSEVSSHLIEAEGEVRRILGLFQAHQSSMVQEDYDMGSMSRWHPSEILSEVISVRATEFRSGIHIAIAIRTAENKERVLGITA